MNIDFKPELLRFLVPPSLFWSTLILSDGIKQIFYHYDILFQYPWIFSFIFISTGFIIGAIGACITHCVDKCKKPVWERAEGEIRYWEKISCKGGYFSKKIETKWHFYYLSLNSALALFLVLLLMLYEHSINCGLIIFIITLILIFIYLAVTNYQRAREFGNIIYEKDVSK